MKTIIKDFLKSSLNIFSNKGSYWEIQHKKKQDIINSYKKTFKYKVFVETGTYLGDMVWAQKDNFTKIYSVELGEDLWKRACDRFKNYSHIKILQGDSGIVLKDLIYKIEEECIFWLDGHYSAGITAKGEKECPIFEELSSIFQSKLKHILLIDDARCFNGKGDYPTIESLSDFVLKHRPESKIEVKEDVIRILL